MWDLIYTQGGLRPKTAPCRNTVDWLCNKLATNRELTLVLGTAPKCTKPFSVQIQNGQRHLSNSQRAEALVDLLFDLTKAWKVEITIQSYGDAVDTILAAIPKMPKSGIKQIDLFRAQTGSVKAFLTLDGLGKGTPSIVNNVEAVPTKRLWDRLTVSTYGPADRPLSNGYLFKHSFWTERQALPRF